MLRNYIIVMILSIWLIFEESRTQPDSIQHSAIDTIKSAIIEIKPDRLEFPHPNDKFITATVKVLNRGADPLYINNIETSCKCASGRTLQNPIYPMEIGKLYLTLNVEGMHDGNNTAEYIVYSNASNSPVNILVKVLSKDSLKIEN